MITDWDDAYENGGHIPNGAAYPPRWEAAAAAFRLALGARAEIDLAYGPRPRQRLDLFLPEGEARGLLVYIHGGYWKARSKSDWSHLAAGPLARGWAVAMPGYTLCPDTDLPGIRAEMVQALDSLAGRFYGPVRLTGHSAGGHLATRLVCSDVTLTLLPRIGRVLSISGVHDLRPLRNCAMNAVLGLDAATAAAESPALLVPHPGIPVTAWVGAAERPEFVRQAALLANIWHGLGADIALTETPGENHFTVIEGLERPDSPLTRALLD